MTVVRTIPIAAFLGTQTTPAEVVPDTAISGALTMDGATMTDPALRVSIAIDFSPDGGATWAATSPGPAMNPFPLIATYNGGSVDKNGKLATSYGPSATFPLGTNRRVRGTFIVDGVPLTTTLTVSLTP